MEPIDNTINNILNNAISNTQLQNNDVELIEPIEPVESSEVNESVAPIETTELTDKYEYVNKYLNYNQTNTNNKEIENDYLSNNLYDIYIDLN